MRPNPLQALHGPQSKASRSARAVCPVIEDRWLLNRWHVSLRPKSPTVPTPAPLRAKLFHRTARDKLTLLGVCGRKSKLCQPGGEAQAPTLRMPLRVQHGRR